jgi:zinc transport system permease protein
MNLDFLYWAAAGGLGLAVLAGPLGSLMVWQRLAYFGDTLAHGALLGVALGLWLRIGGGSAVLATCLGLAILLLVLERSRILAADTLLGILSHSALALGLVALALIPGARVNMEALLFGDLLTITPAEVAAIWALTGVALAVLGWLWTALISITVQEDLARVEGVRVGAIKAVYKLLLAAVVATGMKAVGVLLITALLIIPAASARRLARTPEGMAAVASALASLAVLAGLAASWWLDTPVGPSIVVVAAGLFALSLAVRPV